MEFNIGIGWTNPRTGLAAASVAEHAWTTLTAVNVAAMCGVCRPNRRPVRPVYDRGAIDQARMGHVLLESAKEAATRAGLFYDELELGGSIFDALLRSSLPVGKLGTDRHPRPRYCKPT
jgi:hypothetical protein